MRITDAGGAALIADCVNDRLQVMSASRQWSVVQLEPAERPASALLLNGRLFVASGEDEAVYIYEFK